MKLLEYLNAHFGDMFRENSTLPVSVKDEVCLKGAILTDYEQIERKLYFINSGLIQLTMLHDGEERIIEFFSENEFVCAYTSFLKQEPSDVRVTALVNCETEVIMYSDLQEAYRKSFVANQLGRLFTEQIYMAKTKREKDFLTKSAKERYVELISARPEIFKLVAVNKIAKYLRLHPESLSRIRRTIIS